MDILECFLNVPTLQEMQCPITTTMIRNHQHNDPTLQLARLDQPLVYPIKSISGQELVCRNENPMNGVEDAADWKIYIPYSLAGEVIRWYHVVLGYCCVTKLYNTINTRFHVRRLAVLWQAYRCPDN